jgi:PAS domain S-box-containing protein
VQISETEQVDPHVPDASDGRDELLGALRALGRGEFGVRLPTDGSSTPADIAAAFNDVAELSQRTTRELRRMNRLVGRHGQVGARASVAGAGGGWAQNTEAVNGLIEQLTEPAIQMSRLLGAVATGDLSQRMSIDVDGRPLQGEFRQWAEVVNTMLDQLNAFAGEVTRVAREVGTEGKLGGQADVHGVGGTWKDLTDSVNSMAGNLTDQVRNIAEVTTAVAQGDLSKKVTVDVRGEMLELKNTVNTMVDQLNVLASEVTRVAHEVGTEGKLGGQANVPDVAGTWKDLTDNINAMSSNITDRARNIAEVTKAVAEGDLSKKIEVDVRGEFLEQRRTINTMVDQLNAFAGEVTRVAREVGTEGKLGGQADVPGVAGTWKDLTDSVNSMAGNLTGQVRNIAEVTTAVAQGDLSKKITVDVQGELLELKSTVNTMVDQLNAFAGEVTRVAREVGTEGRLGGQAEVRGVGGTWKDLTDSVNLLAANLTTQVRAIGEVATAVTRGDLSREVQVSASGEVEILKNDINEMIRRLRDTTRENAEQVWLKTNLARFGGLLQGQRDPETVGRLLLSELAPLVGVLTGVIYLRAGDDDAPSLRLIASYARQQAPAPAQRIAFGEGLVGQCATEKRRIVVDDVPPDYVAITSALGKATPRAILVQPVLFEGEIQAIIELASFDPFTEAQLAFLEQLSDSVGIGLNTIVANNRAQAYFREQAARAEAEAGLARLRQVVDAMPEGILLADAAGSVYLHNAAASEILGRIPANVLDDAGGAPEVRRLDGTTCAVAEQPLARAILAQEVVRGEQLVVTNAVNGREVPILVNSVPLSDATDASAGGVAVFQDITPLHELDRQRDEFLAAVSHDLRTPMAIIKGRTDLLRRGLERDGGLDLERVEKGLQAIDVSTVNLVRIVDELLDLTSLRMGQPMELKVAETDLGNLVQRTIDEYRQMDPAQAISYEADGQSLTGEWDGVRIGRVLTNLLSNAVKYSAQETPIIVTTGSEHGAGRRWAVLAVTNTGVGIPADELDRVFDTYFRGTNVAGSIGGTGVGLAGARHIVEQHGGQIGVESVEGGTTTFTVRLPMTPA